MVSDVLILPFNYLFFFFNIKASSTIGQSLLGLLGFPAGSVTGLIGCE